MFDPNGIRFTPTHAVKNGKRYRYYTSQTTINRASKTPPNLARIPAQELENLVTSQILKLLRSPDRCVPGVEGSEKEVVFERIRDFAEGWDNVDLLKSHEFMRRILRRVTVGQTTVWTEVDRGKLLEHFLGGKPDGSDMRGQDAIRLTADYECTRRGSEVRLILPNSGSPADVPAPSLVNVIARSRIWYERIVAGEINSVEQLAKEVKMMPCSTRRVLRWATLSPRLAEAILSGNRGPTLTIQKLSGELPLRWEEQESRFSQTSA